MGEDRARTELLADPRWAEGRVRSRQGLAVGMAWLGPVVLLGLAGVLGWKLLPGLWAQGSPWAWAILVSPLPGLHALVHALRQTLRWRRFGSTTLELDPFPGSLGGHLGGTLQIPLGGGGLSSAVSEGSFRVSVSCIHTRISRSSTRAGQTRWDSVVWSEEVEPALARSAQGIACAFAVPVPEDLPPTELASESYHHWAVRVAGELPGEDFDQAFEVPVLATPEPLHARHVEPSRPPAAASRAGRSGDLPRRTVRVAPTSRGVRLHYPMGRERAAGIPMTVVGGLFCGLGVFFGTRSAGELASLDPLALVMGGVGGLVALAAALFGLVLLLLGLYLLANSLEVDLDPQRVRARRRLLGIPVATRSGAVADLAGIEMTITGQLGQGAQASVSYRITARLPGGKRLALGDGIRGTPVATALAALVEEATGHPVQRKARSSRLERAGGV